MYKVDLTYKIKDEYLMSIVENVAKANNISDWKHSVAEFERIGQNYFGELVPINLSGKVNEEESKTLPVVLKLAPLDEKFRVSGAITSMFSREIFIYSVLLEKYKELQTNFKREFQYVIPTCYYVRDEYCKEVIAMENMCAAGYKCYIEKVFLDYKHIDIALKTLAKFHALSFILKETDRNFYNNAKKVCLPLTAETNKRFLNILDDRLMKALQKFQGTEYVQLLQDLKDCCNTYIEAISDSTNLICICHGDIWKENILFSYENDNPVSACFIDYQTARTCSPAFDVLYLIASSTDSKLRSKHFYDLLSVYYNMFEQVLKEAGYEMKELYSRELFNDDLKIVGPACLIVANTALWLANGLQVDGHVKSKIVCSTEAEKAQAVERYKSLIQGIIEDFVQYGYLCGCSLKLIT